MTIARGSIVHMPNPENRERFNCQSPNGYVVLNVTQAHGHPYVRIVPDNDRPISLLAELFVKEK